MSSTVLSFHRAQALSQVPAHPKASLPTEMLQVWLNLNVAYSHTFAYLLQPQVPEAVFVCVDKN